MKKVLRFLLILILVLIVGIVLLGLFAPKDYKMERSVTIKGAQEDVFRQMVEYRNWNNWSPWYEMEPTMQITYKGTDGQPGSGYHWKGSDDKTGEGEITTTSATNTDLNYKVKFLKPWESEADGYLKAESIGNGETKATWGFSTHVPFPWNAMMVFMNFEKAMAKDFDRGLSLMKTYVENHPHVSGSSTFNIRSTNFPGGTYAVVRKDISWSEMDKFFSDAFGKLGSSLKDKIRGNAVGLYYKWDEQNKRTDLAAGFPVDKGTQVGAGATVAEVPASSAYMVEYVGGYGGSAKAHEALGKHVAAQGKKQNLVIEEYVKSSNSEPDSNKWITNIYYLVP